MKGHSVCISDHMTPAVVSQGVQPHPITGLQKGGWAWRPWLAVVLVFVVLLDRGVDTIRHHSHIKLDPTKMYTGNIKVTGCDVWTSYGAHTPAVELVYWRFIGHGALNLDLTTMSITVRAEMRYRLYPFRCNVRIYATDECKSLNFSTLAIESLLPQTAQTDHFQYSANSQVLINLGCFGVDELSVTAHSPATVVTIHSVTARKAITSVGKDTCKLHLDLDTVQPGASVNLHVGDDSFIHLVGRQLKAPMILSMDADSSPYAALAAAGPRSPSPTSDGVFFLDSSENENARSRASSFSVSVKGRSSTYARIGASPSYPPYLGEHQKTPTLMKQSDLAIKALQQWYDLTKPTNFVIFMSPLHPHAPQGTFRLLSSTSYLALSLDKYTMISGGMMTPELLHIELPLCGFSKNWPKRSDESTLEWAKTVYLLFRDHIPPNLNQSVVVWNDAATGPYIIHTDRHGEVHAHPPVLFDFFLFLVAGGVSLCLGVLIGLAVLFAIKFYFLPWASQLMRDASVHTMSATRSSGHAPWPLTASEIHWPTHGILVWWPQKNMQGVVLDFKMREVHGGVNSDIVVSVSRTLLAVIKDIQALACYFPMKPMAPPPRVSSTFDSKLVDQHHDQARLARAPLGTHRHYIVSAVAYDENGKSLAKSGKTIPVHIGQQAPFILYPLLLWRSVAGLLPNDTLGNFMERYCSDGESLPRVRLQFHNLGLAMHTQSDAFLPHMGVNLVFKTGKGYPTKTDIVKTPSPEPNYPLWSLKDLLQGVIDDDIARIMGATKKREDLKPNETYIMTDNRLCTSVEFSSGLGGCLDVHLKEKNGLTLGTMSTTLREVMQHLHRHTSKDTGYLAADRFFMLRTTQGAEVANLIGDVDVVNTHLLASETGKWSWPTRELGVDSMITQDAFGCVVAHGEHLPVSWDIDHAWLQPDSGDTGSKKALSFHLVCKLPDPMDGGPSIHRCKLTEFPIFSDVGSYDCICAPSVFDEGLATSSVRAYIEIRDASVDKRSNECSGALLARTDFFVIVRTISLKELELAYGAWCYAHHLPARQVDNVTLASRGVGLYTASVTGCHGYRPLLPYEAQRYDLSSGRGSKIIKMPHSFWMTSWPSDRPTVSQELSAASHPKSSKAGRHGRRTRAADPDAEAQVHSADIPDGQNEPGMIDCSIGADHPMTSMTWRPGLTWVKEILFQYRFMPPYVDKSTMHDFFFKPVEMRLRGLKDQFSHEDEATVQAPNTIMPQTTSNVRRRGIVSANQPDIGTGAIDTSDHKERRQGNTAWLIWDVIGTCTIAKCIQLEWVGRFVLRFANVALFILDVAEKYVPGAIEFLLAMALYGAQSLVLMLPAVVALAVCILNDLATSAVDTDLVQKTYFTSFLAHPTIGHFAELGSGGQSVLVLAGVCQIVILVDIYFWMFVDQGKLPHLTSLFRWVDCAITFLSGLALLIGIIYVCVTLLWFLMGALVDPGTKLPKAVMIAGFIFIARSKWTHLTGMKEQLVTKLRSLIDEGVKYMAEGILEELGAVDTAKDPATLASQSIRQKLLDAEQTLKNKMTAGVAKVCANAEAVVQDCGEKVVSLTSVGGPKAKAGEETSVVQEVLDLVRQLGLSAEVGHILHELHKAVMSYTHLQKGSLPLPTSLEEFTTVVQDLRKGHLVDAFDIKAKEPSDPVPTCKASADNLDTSDVNDSFTTVQSHLRTMAWDELSTLNSTKVKILSQLLDRPTLHGRTKQFIHSDLFQGIVPDVFGDALNFDVPDSVTSTALRSIASLLQEAVPDGAEIPADTVGDVSTSVLTGAKLLTDEIPQESRDRLLGWVQRFRDDKGVLTKHSFLHAMNLFLVLRPDTAEQTETDAAYLWYDGFRECLLRLGLAEEEIADAWLKPRWMKLTTGKNNKYPGFLRYESLLEPQSAFSSLTERCLWQKAMSVMMREVEINGFIGCTDADQVRASKTQGHRRIREEHQWPEFLQQLWTDPNNGFIDPVNADPGAPLLMPLHNADQFIIATVLDDESVKPEHKLEQVTVSGDTLWYVESETLSLWLQDNVLGQRRVRGVWYEAAMKIFAELKCVPDTDDIYFEALCNTTGLNTSEASAAASDEYTNKHFLFGGKIRTYMHNRLNDTTMCTFDEFKAVVQKLGISTSEQNLKHVYFHPLARAAEGSDLHQREDKEGTRSLPHLGASLMTFLDGGVWPQAVKQIITKFLPPSPWRDAATSRVDMTFKKYDKDGSGVVCSSQLIFMLRDVLTPGVDLSTMIWLIRDKIAIPMPHPMVEKHFKTGDVDKDDSLNPLEFIMAMRNAFLEYVPSVVMGAMGLANKQIIATVVSALVVLSLLFVLISLVIQAFTDKDGSIGTIVQTITSLGAVVMVQRGKSGQAAQVVTAAGDELNKLEHLALGHIMHALNLSQTMMDKWTQRIAAMWNAVS